MQFDRRSFAIGTGLLWSIRSPRGDSDAAAFHQRMNTPQELTHQINNKIIDNATLTDSAAVILHFILKG